MSIILDFLNLLRVKQWYKNVVVFIPVIFSFNLFNFDLLILSAAGFFSLCFISSASYIINDIKDMDKDKYHPEKKNRPLVSGKISKTAASVSSVLMFVLSIATVLTASILFPFFNPTTFILAVLALFLLSQIYTFQIKKVAFMDMILISINFVIRATSGTFIINYSVSYWVILLTFFISMFLVSVKRSAEIEISDIGKYREGFKKLDKNVLQFIAVISATCIFVFFSIYSILHERVELLLSLPFALYITFMFFHNLYVSPVFVRNPENFVFKKEIILCLVLWFIVVVFALYFPLNHQIN